MNEVARKRKSQMNYKELLETQRELFRILEEFFERATGKKRTDFASPEDLGEEIRKNAHELAPRALEAFKFAHRVLPEFYSGHGKESFGNAGKIGGLKFVIGGQSRFTISHLDSVKRVALYTDTILIPDPILPWLEVPRPEERFPDVEFLNAAFILLQLKPLVDADLSYPAVFVFPSWEKSLEKSDTQTQANIESLTCGVISKELGREFESLSHLLVYAKGHESEFLRAVDRRRMFIGPGGNPNQHLAENIELYRQHMKEWRTDDFQATAAGWSTAELVVRGLVERFAPQSHLLENAEEFAANPMLCLEVHWYYYMLCAEYFEQRLKDQGLLSSDTIADVRAMNQPELEWLSNVPVEALAELRSNNENEDFRARIRSFTQQLHRAGTADLDRIAAEVSRGIASLLAEHQRKVRAIDEEFRARYKKTAAGTWIGAAALLVPALAPFLPALSAGGAALKFINDKIDERRARREHARSLLGVLAAASEPSDK